MNEKLIEKILEKYLLWDTKIEETESIYIWKYIILRARNAWVHFGKLEYAKNWVYRLSESRRLYYWEIKNKQWVSLSDLAIQWLNDNSKVCTMINLIEITEREWAEIIPVSEWVIDSFKNAKIYIP